jgi:predicted nucleotidyltransferase
LGSIYQLLVEFEEGHEPGLIGIARLERELSAFFDGRSIDLRTPADLSRNFRDEVLASAEERYAG